MDIWTEQCNKQAMKKCGYYISM